MQLQYKALATGGTVHFASMPGYLRARRAGSSACWVNTQPAQEALEQQRRKSVTRGGSQAPGTGWRGRFDGPGYLKQGEVGVLLDGKGAQDRSKSPIRVSVPRDISPAFQPRQCDDLGSSD